MVVDPGWTEEGSIRAQGTRGTHPSRKETREGWGTQRRLHVIQHYAPVAAWPPCRFAVPNNLETSRGRKLPRSDPRKTTARAEKALNLAYSLSRNLVIKPRISLCTSISFESELRSWAVL